MKGKIVLLALLLSAVPCSQGFGFELLDRILGLNCGNCGACDACGETACCEPAAKSCAPEPACCEEPAYCEEPKCCEEPECYDPCGSCGKKRCDLFAGLKELFQGNKGCGKTSCCEQPQSCAPEPACCEEPVSCEEPKCCEEPACCEPSCGKKRCGNRPLLDLLDDLFGGGKCGKKSCCEPACCETVCGGCGGGGEAAPAEAPADAPSTAAPLPKAPVEDQSVSLYRTRSIYPASRSIIQR